MQLREGDRLGRYEIVSLLGQGGMGEVYRARDSELDREVAIKVLPEEVAADAGRLARFKREAKAVAKLSHSSILEIFDFGRQDDVTYAVTELLEGMDLGEAINSKNKALSRQKVLDIAATVAEGLAVAHANGVVHRDIKPGNLFLCSDGRIKILDFGLASLRSQVSGDATTASMDLAVSTPGSVLGTVGYMSPEQVRGEQADHRSDIFSLGCVLYELLAGRRPFQRDTSVETMAAILREDVPSLAESGVEADEDLQKIVVRCLEKDLGKRFQSASGLAFALRENAEPGSRSSITTPASRSRLRRWVMVPAAVLTAAALVVIGMRLLWNRASPVAEEGTIRSIAVLPLANLSGDPDQEFFAEGMTEALITDLSRISALKVISRTSVMRFKDTQLSLPEIAQQLGVDAVVEGSVQLEAGRVRITAQLVDAATDSHLWADTFQRELISVLALQSEIARSIANAIEVEVSPQEETRLTKTREIDPETYRAYLRGMHHLKKGGDEDFKKGMAFLHEALENDPADPFAYAGLAQGYVMWGHDAVDGAEYFKRAKAAAKRALELDENLAEAHAAIADASMYHDWDWEAADSAFQKAIELNPNLAEVHAHYAWLHLLRGNLTQAIAEGKLAQDLDPLGPAFTSWLTELYLGAGRYDEALVENDKAFELYPDWPRAHADRGWAYAGKGLFEEAYIEYQAASETVPRWAAHYGRVLIKGGRLEEAGRLLSELTAISSEIPPPALASFQALYGDLDGAMDTLEHGFETRNPAMPWIGSWYEFGELTDDPRFLDLLDRMDLEIIPPPPPETP